MKQSVEYARKKEKVLALRSKGMTYERIAKAAGVSIPTVGNWLRSGTSRRPAEITPQNVKYIKTTSNASNTMKYLSMALESFQALLREIA